MATAEVNKAPARGASKAREPLHDDDPAAVPRGGRAAVLGRPNAGKSTLLNALLGQSLVAVTAKPGTTRYCCVGVVHRETPALQLALVDTPGIAAKSKAMQKALALEAQQALTGVDAAVLLVDGAMRRRDAGDLVHPEDKALLETLNRCDVPVVLAVNKVDKVKPRDRMLPLLEAYSALSDFAAVVPISARKGQNLEALLKELHALMPPGHPFDAEMLTDRPMRFFFTEALREAALEQTRQEVPHGLAVRIDSFLETPTRISADATLFVEKDAHKGIVLGKGGTRLGSIGKQARLHLEALTGKQIVLKVFVKVADAWTRSDASVASMRDEESGGLR